MSETVHYKGKATRLKDDYLTTLGIARKIIENKGKLSEVDAGQEIQYLCEEYSEEFFSYGNYLYELKYESLDADDEIIRAVELQDGTIVFELRFYNGGAGFDECLEEAFEKMSLK